MRLLTKMLKQKCVYWPPGSEETGGRDFDDYGRPVYATAIEIRCRWEDVVEEFIKPDGTQDTSRSKVYVDRDVRVGGVLWLGNLAGVSDLVNPKQNDGAWEIKRFDKLPTLKAAQFLRTAFL
jgi:hypothetical protein